jgi:hypothetical protein
MKKLILKWQTLYQSGLDVIIAPTSVAECFHSFLGKPYNEREEFAGYTLAIGSAGWNYFCNGRKETNQIILKIDPGHKQGNNEPHINKYFGFLKPTKPIRTKIPTEMNHIIRIAPWIKTKTILIDGDKEIIIGESIVNLKNKIK